MDDILALIGHDVTLRRVAATHGGEWAGPCPFCGGHEKRDSDRFRVWPAEGRYWCRRCGRKGDAIQYVRDRYNLTFAQAKERLGLETHSRADANAVMMPRHEPTEPPSDLWQARAVTFCADCAERLWTTDGERALRWLREVRGLTDETIRAAGLGYHDVDRRERPESWGLTEDHAAVWLPRGIVIPWWGDGHMWRVNIRRPVGEPKYVAPAGSGPGLYGVDVLGEKPVVLVEGEFDALIIHQVAADLVTVVATGSTAGGRRTRWLARLAVCPVVLVAFDADRAGEEAAQYWLDVLSNARRWRPYYGKDVSEQAHSGGDVRGWVLAGLREGQEALLD